MTRPVDANLSNIIPWLVGCGLIHQESGMTQEVFRIPGTSRLLVIHTDRCMDGKVVSGKGAMASAAVALWAKNVFPAVPKNTIAFGRSIDGFLPEDLREDRFLWSHARVAESARKIPVGMTVYGKAGSKPSVLALTPFFSKDGHEVAISLEEAEELMGEWSFRKAKNLALHMFYKGSEFAQGKGANIIGANFRFGEMETSPERSIEIAIIGDIFSPDSSRISAIAVPSGQGAVWGAEVFEALSGRTVQGFQEGELFC